MIGVFAISGSIGFNRIILTIVVSDLIGKSKQVLDLVNVFHESYFAAAFIAIEFFICSPRAQAV